MPEVQASPRQHHLLVRRPQVVGKVVRLPVLGVGAREKPARIGGPHRVPGQARPQRRTDRHRPIGVGLGRPGLAVNRLGPHAAPAAWGAQGGFQISRFEREMGFMGSMGFMGGGRGRAGWGAHLGPRR